MTASCFWSRMTPCIEDETLPLSPLLLPTRPLLQAFYAKPVVLEQLYLDEGTFFENLIEALSRESEVLLSLPVFAYDITQENEHLAEGELSEAIIELGKSLYQVFRYLKLYQKDSLMYELYGLRGLDLVLARAE